MSDAEELSYPPVTTLVLVPRVMSEPVRLRCCRSCSLSAVPDEAAAEPSPSRDTERCRGLVKLPRCALSGSPELLREISGEARGVDVPEADSRRNVDVDADAEAKAEDETGMGWLISRLVPPEERERRMGRDTERRDEG